MYPRFVLELCRIVVESLQTFPISKCTKSTNMLFCASTKCSFTVTFTNDALSVTIVFTTMVILTVLIASVIPTQLTLCISACLSMSEYKLS